MRSSKIAMLAAVASLGYAAGTIPDAQATFVVTIDQVGSNVVATGIGTIDLGGLSFSSNLTQQAFVYPVYDAIGVGSSGASALSLYFGTITGPNNFGPGGATLASSGTGDLVLLSENVNIIAVPQGYVSGSALSDTSTYDNVTLASLGLTAGTYVYTFGSGATADSFTIDIVAPTIASAPEPASIALLAAGLTGLCLVGRHRKPV